MDKFVQTMKDWRRMCKVYTTDDETCCEGCPVADFREHGCGAVFEMEDSTDWERYEGAIREWAAEHQEPVYPTWAEYLTAIGVYPKGWELYQTPLIQQIPADIAQKLEIEPKEG